jgi:hypothetical protein
MTEPVIAPYGGLMTKTLDDEKERESKLEEQAVDIVVNGTSETIRPEALHLRGVDSLSTDDIKAFIDYYINYNVFHPDDDSTSTVYEPLPIDEQKTLRIEWINDSSVNVVFQTYEIAQDTLSKLSITGSNPNIPKPEVSYDLAEAVQERETKLYNPILTFKKQRDLSSRLGIETQQETAPIESMEEDESSVVLYVRQALQSDKKVKNAKLYSRYYLIHGEPERRERGSRRGRGRGRSDRGGRRGRDDRREDRRQEQVSDEEDLFANKMKNGNRQEDEEEDLFAHKMRERSPGRDREHSPMNIDTDRRHRYT